MKVRAKEDVALLLKLELWECMRKYKEMSFRLMYIEI